MPTSTVPARDERVERLIMEQAELFARALQESANQAVDGQVLACAERVAVTQGREFVRKALALTLQGQAETLEKKGPPPVAANADIVGITKEHRPKKC